MENKIKINQLVIGAAVFVLILVGAGFWYLQSKKGVTEKLPSGAEEILNKEAIKADEETVEAGFGAQVLQKVQNPIKDKLPETNPFQANTNPFQAETNPLKTNYQNPFGE